MHDHTHPGHDTGHPTDSTDSTDTVPDIAEALPPYSGDDTVCVMCKYVGALTFYRPARPMPQMVTVNGRAQWSGPLPARLQRQCMRCQYQWDEALASRDAEEAHR